MDTEEEWPHDEPELSCQPSPVDDSSSVMSSSSSVFSQSIPRNIVDLTIDTVLPTPPSQTGDPVSEVRELTQVVVDAVIYRPLMTVELIDGRFFRIERLVERDKEYFAFGRTLLMATDDEIEAYIPKVRGELVWIAHETRPIYLDQVKQIRRIRFTNRRREVWRDHKHLVCRLKLTVRSQAWMSQDGQSREPLGAAETIIEYLLPDEADPELRIPSKVLRETWRGETTPFGAGRLPPGVRPATSNRPEIIDVENPPAVTVDLTHADQDGDPDQGLQTYTFGDAFCGAGGVSCGAHQAGLDIKWAFDRDHHAMDTYRRNFDAPIMENSEVFQFMTNQAHDMLVDVCHCSPPCQPFSPAHTVHNEARDEINSACIFTASDLVKKARPRVLTMEETYGLAQRHKPVFHRMLMDLVEIGYSVRWAILECVNYGVPQWRRRLIILASGPGETLPELPEPTHGLPGGGLLPLNTIHTAIDRIPMNWPDHDVESGYALWQLRGRRQPYNKYQPARTVTCSGGEFNYHPSGDRPFTCREFACLQTFPMTYKFSVHRIRPQIGNAVPPALSKAIYCEVHRSLRETDEREMRVLQ